MLKVLGDGRVWLTPKERSRVYKLTGCHVSSFKNEREAQAFRDRLKAPYETDAPECQLMRHLIEQSLPLSGNTRKP